MVASTERRWGFLTNHAVIMIYVVQHPRSTVREVAIASGLTERATLSILQDLQEEGIIDRRREGRRNVYTVNLDVAAEFKREGRSPDLVPDFFVVELLRELLRLGGDSGAEDNIVAAAVESTR